jgi:hypothetical protein
VRYGVWSIELQAHPGTVVEETLYGPAISTARAALAGEPATGLVVPWGHRGQGVERVAQQPHDSLHDGQLDPQAVPDRHLSGNRNRSHPGTSFSAMDDS